MSIPNSVRTFLHPKQSLTFCSAELPNERPTEARNLVNSSVYVI